jgi:hypothetical protein
MQSLSQFDGLVLDGLPPCENGWPTRADRHGSASDGQVFPGHHVPASIKSLNWQRLKGGPQFDYPIDYSVAVTRGEFRLSMLCR